MKFSERLFLFPVRVYDRFSTEKAQRQEEDINKPIEGDWREGKVRIPHYELSSWSDFFDSEQGPEGVDADGFYNTLVWTQEEGSYVCTWPRTLFEKKLDEHVAKYEEWEKTITKEGDLEL